MGRAPDTQRQGRRLATRFAPSALPMAMFVVAFGVRALHVGTPVYGDEAAHYYLAKHPFQNPANVLELGGGTGGLMSLHFWSRPAFHLMLYPAAAVSFDAYRLLHAFLSALLAPLAMLLLRSAGMAPWVAALTGLAAALFPALVNWGVVAFPDSLATMLFLAALLARSHGRGHVAAALFVAAIWTKEICAVGFLYVLAWDAVAGFGRNENRLFPLRIDESTRRNVGCMALGLAPLAFYLARGGRAPGWSPGSGSLDFADGLLPATILLPLLLFGLLSPRTRFVSGLALVYPAFYLVYSTMLGRGVESWYMMQPVTLGLLGCAFVVGGLVERRARRPRRAQYGLGLGAAFLVFGLVAVHVLVPSSWGPKSDLLAPMSRGPQPSLAEVHENPTPDFLREMRDQLSKEDRRHPFLIDFGWFFIAYPMSEGAASVRYGYTGYELSSVAEVHRWTSRIENSTATIVHTPASLSPLNEAIRAAYADCRTFVNGDYEVFRGRECGDRLAVVVVEYESRVGRRLA